MIDFDERVEVVDVGEITNLVRQVQSVDEEIAALEQALKERQGWRRKLTEDMLPSAFDEAGVAEVTLPSGARIRIVENLYASIPKKSKAEAVAWLEAHGLGSLVALEVIAQFGKGEQTAARHAADMLRSLGLSPAYSESVNTSSVKAAIKELMSQGVDVPLDVFGAHIVRCAEIKAGK
jgi:hypothetical protein